MENNKMIYKIDDFSIENDDLLLNETIFHNANGYIGVRSNFEEGYPESYNSIRGSYINGFYDIAEMKQAEGLYGLVTEKQTMLNVADTQGIQLILDGEVFNMFEGEVIRSTRWVHMAEGYTGRMIQWRSPKGKEVEIRIKRMTSFYKMSLFTIEYQVKSLNFDGEIEFISTHKGEVMNYHNPDDPRVAEEGFKHILPSEIIVEDGISYITSATSRSGLHVCTAVKNILSKEASSDSKIDEYIATNTLKTSIGKDETIVLTKYTVFSDSIRNKDCKGFAKKEMQASLEISLDELYNHQKDYFKEYWDNCELEIEGDDDLSSAVRYNMYQLIQSVGKDEYSNIAAKGLSGEGYEGHYFWDTEMYIQPFFTLTNPEISKGLIEYRYNILDEARKHAAIMGHKKGVLYPWRTIMGKECSGYFPSGSAQYHINGDISHSIVAYYLATKDIGFIADKGAEIMIETARLWLDAGNYHKGLFLINEVTGPDEYTCMVNNNYYTNASAQYNLRWAAKFYRMLKEQGKADGLVKKLQLDETEIEEFDRAADAMFLPYDEELGINPQDDSFLSKEVWDIENTPKDKFPLLLHYHPLHLYRHQVCKQADTVLAHFIYEDAQSLETIRKSFAYYEKVTTHDSSLSTCIYSIVASKLGLEEKAYDYFGDSAKLDLFNTHKNTKDGIHTANMGGNYMAIVYGFAGLRLKEDGIHFSPSLPRKWTQYAFNINYEGSKIKVTVKQDETVFALLKGDAKIIFVNGKKYSLKDNIVVKRYKAIIFDLDGVICHTDEYHYLAWKELADRLGIYFDKEINNRLRGVSRMESFEIILERYEGEPLSEEQKIQYAEDKNDIYKVLLEKMSPKDLSDEVKGTLDALRAKGLTLAIGSSSKNAPFILKQIGLEGYFDAISDGNNITKSKPDPEVFIKASEYIKIAAEDCLVIEDADAGVEAAIAGQMDSAAIGDATLSGKATYNLTTFSDLLKII